MGHRARILSILVILAAAALTGYAVRKRISNAPEQVKLEARNEAPADKTLEAARELEQAVRDRRLKFLGEAVTLAMEYLGTTGIVVDVKGEGLATVSLGRGHEVKRGVRFHIVREKVYVGSFLAEMVRKGWVAGRLEPEMTGSGAPPRYDDRAWTE